MKQVPVWITGDGAAGMDVHVETATTARADRYKRPDEWMGWIYKPNLKIVSTHLYMKPVSTQLWNGWKEKKKKYRKWENRGKKKNRLAGLDKAHQAIAQQAIALEAEAKHQIKRGLKRIGSDGTFATSDKWFIK